MKPAEKSKIVKFIEPRISDFHQRRLENLSNLKLNKILARKNPYLFKAKNQNTAHDLVKSILDAYLSSQEEGIFGGFLEELAIFISEIFFQGKKSAAEGIDLELQKNGIHYLVSIKSGPNWGNSRQIAKMKDDFKRAKRVLGTNVRNQKVVAINGCCYGRDNHPDKGDYLKLCGQEFWEFLSDDNDLYTDLIEPIGFRAKEKNEAFEVEYAKVINRFTHEFSSAYCSPDGTIQWEKLVSFNSGKA
ncbi:MAG: cytosolic protein [Lentisphaerae bacterium]|jgi:hypothetical protein|nr:cytosolic protein [Lentisphaerota bacterium]